MGICLCEYCRECLWESLHDPSRLCTSAGKIEPHTSLVSLKSLLEKGNKTHSIGWCGAFAILHGVLGFSKEDIELGGKDIIDYYLSFLASKDLLNKHDKWTGGFYFYQDSKKVLDFFGVRFEHVKIPADDRKTLNRFVGSMRTPTNTGKYLIAVNKHIMFLMVDAEGEGVPVDQWHQRSNFLWTKRGSLGGRSRMIKRPVDQYITILSDVTDNSEYITAMRDIVNRRKRERNTRPPPAIAAAPPRPVQKPLDVPSQKDHERRELLTDRLIPREPGPVVCTFSYPNSEFPDRKYRQVMDHRDFNFEMVFLKLVYGEPHKKGPDILLVDDDCNLSWIHDSGQSGIPPPPKDIQHAHFLNPSDIVDRSMFTAEEWRKWQALSKNNMVVGARFMDDSIGFLVWEGAKDEPDDMEDADDDSEDTEGQFLGGKWHPNPFVADVNKNETVPASPQTGVTPMSVDPVPSTPLQPEVTPANPAVPHTGVTPAEIDDIATRLVKKHVPETDDTPMSVDPVPSTPLQPEVTPANPAAPNIAQPAPPQTKPIPAEIDDIASWLVTNHAPKTDDTPVPVEPGPSTPTPLPPLTTHTEDLILHGRLDPQQLCRKISCQKYHVLTWTHFDLAGSDSPTALNNLTEFLMQPSWQIMEFHQTTNPKSLMAALRRVQRPTLNSLLLDVGIDDPFSASDIRSVGPVMKLSRSFALRVPLDFFMDGPGEDTARAWHATLSSVLENDTTSSLYITAPIQRSLMALTPRELDPALNHSVLCTLQFPRCGLDNRCSAKFTMLLYGCKLLERVDVRGNNFSDVSLEDWEGLVASDTGRHPRRLKAIDLSDNAFTVVSQKYSTVLYTGAKNQAIGWDDNETNEFDKEVLGQSFDGTLRAVLRRNMGDMFVQITGRVSMDIPIARIGPVPVHVEFDPVNGDRFEIAFEDGSTALYEEVAGATGDMWPFGRVQTYVAFR